MRVSGFIEKGTSEHLMSCFPEAEFSWRSAGKYLIWPHHVLILPAQMKKNSSHGKFTPGYS
jgi:hypothetical protein